MPEMGVSWRPSQVGGIFPDQLGEKAYGEDNVIQKICWREPHLEYLSNGEMLALVLGRVQKIRPLLGTSKENNSSKFLRS